MKFKIFLMITICTGMVLPSAGRSSKKINKKGKYLPYYGYTIIAKIDPILANTAYRIQESIKKSTLRYRYSALPSDTYHMSIFTIYSIGNKLIPPVKKWKADTGLQIPKHGWLPDDVLEEQNNKATCILERFITEPLHIKYATLNFGSAIIKLKLILDDESIKRIKNARNELKKVYEHPNASLEPIDKTVHMTLAYAYKKSKLDNLDDWNTLNELVREFNGANLTLTAVYLFENMSKYKLFEKKDYFSCSEFFRD